MRVMHSINYNVQYLDDSHYFLEKRYVLENQYDIKICREKDTITVCDSPGTLT